MGLREWILLIKKWHKILMLTILVALLTNSILNLFILDRIFESKISLMINRDSTQEDTGIEYEDILLGEKLVDAYSIVAKSDDVLEGIIEELELEHNIKKLKEEIIIVAKPENRMIDISFEDKDPNQALEKANAFIEIFQETIQNMFHIDNIQVINWPKPPEEPIRPKVGINLVISFFLGSLSGVLIIMLVENFDKGLKEKRE